MASRVLLRSGDERCRAYRGAAVERLADLVRHQCASRVLARWRFDLEPDGDGSRLTFTARIGPAPSGLTPAIERMPDREEDIVAKRMGEHNANMTRTIEGYKQLIESTAATE